VYSSICGSPGEILAGRFAFGPQKFCGGFMRAREEVAHVRVICARIYTSLARTLPRGSGIHARDYKTTFRRIPQALHFPDSLSIAKTFTA
jgi:hypothetical protein